ncbi:MAG: YHS domain-containing (seleno)protein [Pseudomonadota bacterium]
MLTRRTLLFAAAAAPAVAVLATRAAAAEPPVFSRKGAAINGYDPVAYFTDGAPVEGSAEFSTEWNGTTWQFANAQNLASFEADPESFAPQFGGYCAYAVARGYTASTDPDAWTVHNGKLYLNFSKGIRRRWLRDIDGEIANGEANWPSVLA